MIRKADGFLQLYFFLMQLALSLSLFEVYPFIWGHEGWGGSLGRICFQPKKLYKNES